ncbi:hypothetical protein ACU5AX_18910 [Sphingomonas sp. XXL09]|uniref:hypothetical protein n=1 Tax=Sphingomonas sp. XXL09 TaxID=3457787 RepID=UPI00406BA9DD
MLDFTGQSQMHLTGLIRVFAIGILCLLVLMDLGLGIETSYFGVFFCAAISVLFFYNHRYTSLGAILLFVSTSIYFIPYLALHVVREPIHIAWYALFDLVGLAMVIDSRPIFQGRDSAKPKNPFVTLGFMIIILAIGVAVVVLRSEDPFSGPLYLASWGLALIPLEQLQRSGSNFRFVSLGLFLLSLGVYVGLGWEGGGRIVVVSLALAPLLLAAYYGAFRINGLFLAGAGIMLVFVGRVLRFGWGNGLAGVAEDSGATHILLSSQIWSNNAHTSPVTTFLEQYVLYFSNWVPRNLWHNKPVSVNYSFVDVYIGRSGLSEEFSTAVGFFGEEIYYSPRWWLALTLIVVVTTLITRRIIKRISYNFVVPVIIFDVWLVTLFWGGMASFGARIWFSLIPAIVYILILRRIDGSRHAPVCVDGANHP